MDLKKYCKPAQIYAVISAISILMIFLQNVSDLGSNYYCVGTMECNLRMNNIVMFALKLAYVVINVIILDSLCKNGYERLSWAFVLSPFIGFFIMIGLVMINSLAQ